MYYGMFAGPADIENNFGCNLPEGAEILFAWYEDQGWGHGGADVVYRVGSTLYEVHGSHCSCYGLEGQWEPEETTAAALALYRYGEPNEYDEGDPLLRAAWRDLIARLQ